MSNRSTIVSGQNSHRYVVNLFYTVFQKTRDHVLDDKFTKIFGTLITKSIGHRLVFYFSASPT